jgi:hyperosmotically inducible periplasmic protein
MNITRFSAILLLLSLMLTPVFSADKAVSDDAISDQVRLRLAGDPDVGARAIEVGVSHGAVTLTGKVRSEKQKDKAGKLTKKVKGVQSVDNKLVVTQE